jgi:hypothetical protein
MSRHLQVLLFPCRLVVLVPPEPDPKILHPPVDVFGIDRVWDFEPSVFNEEFLLFWKKLTLSSLTNRPHEWQAKHTFGQELVIHHFA